MLYEVITFLGPDKEIDTGRVGTDGRLGMQLKQGIDVEVSRRFQPLFQGQGVIRIASQVHRNVQLHLDALFQVAGDIQGQGLFLDSAEADGAGVLPSYNFV